MAPSGSGQTRPKPPFKVDYGTVMTFQPSTYSPPSLPEDGTTSAAVAEVLDAIRENVLAANQLQVCSRADIFLDADSKQTITNTACI